MSDLKNENRFKILVIKSISFVRCLKCIDDSGARNKRVKVRRTFFPHFKRLLRASEASIDFTCDLQVYRVFNGNSESVFVFQIGQTVQKLWSFV